VPFPVEGIKDILGQIVIRCELKKERETSQQKGLYVMDDGEECRWRDDPMNPLFCDGVL